MQCWGTMRSGYYHSTVPEQIMCLCGRLWSRQRQQLSTCTRRKLIKHALARSLDLFPFPVARVPINNVWFLRRIHERWYSCCAVNVLCGLQPTDAAGCALCTRRGGSCLAVGTRTRGAHAARPAAGRTALCRCRTATAYRACWCKKDGRVRSRCQHAYPRRRC